MRTLYTYKYVMENKKINDQTGFFMIVIIIYCTSRNSLFLFRYISTKTVVNHCLWDVFYVRRERFFKKDRLGPKKHKNDDAHAVRMKTSGGSETSRNV